MSSSNAYEEAKRQAMGITIQYYTPLSLDDSGDCVMRALYRGRIQFMIEGRAVGPEGSWDNLRKATKKKLEVAEKVIERGYKHAEIVTNYGFRAFRAHTIVEGEGFSANADTRSEARKGVIEAAEITKKGCERILQITADEQDRLIGDAKKGTCFDMSHPS